MKLKKIASLALAGLMAVSMLAGCGDNSTGNSGNGVTGEVVTGTSSIVDAVNNGQSVVNDAEVTFSSDSVLDAALKKAVEMYGDMADRAHLKQAVINLTGIEEDAMDFYDADEVTPDLDGKTVTKLEVFEVPVALSEDAAKAVVAKGVDAYIADLAATTYVKGTTAIDDEYYDYSYTGTISLVSAETVYGTTNYYVALTITQTVTEQKLEK